MLFFGGRVKATDFEMISSRDGQDATFVDDVEQEGAIRGIVITWLPRIKPNSSQK